MVVLALGRADDPAAIVPVLESLLDDPEVSGHATEALAMTRHPAAASGLRRMLNDKRGWVRLEAQKGLARLGQPGT